MYKPLQLLLFLHGVDVRVVGEGSHCVSSVYVCMCVSSSDFLPPPHLSLPLSSPPPSVSFLLCSSLLAGNGEHQLLHYIDGESSPTPHTHSLTHTHCVSTVHCGNHTVILPSLLSRQMESFHALHPVLFFKLMRLTRVRPQRDFSIENTGQW